MGNLLQAEIAEKQARSIRYQVTIAKLPLIKEVAEFDFTDTLLRPENKAMLTGVLTYHVVPSRLDFATLADRIRAGGGTTSLTTVQGPP